MPPCFGARVAEASKDQPRFSRSSGCSPSCAEEAQCSPSCAKAGVMHKMCRASRTVATISRQGTWCLAAEQIAIAEGNVAETPSTAVAPPAYAALNDAACLQPIKEMYELLGRHTQWLTCVVCWQAWYTVDSQKPMSPLPSTWQTRHFETLVQL